ncbi:hypothetical protein R3P38DRAFT_3200841 [Favolaschia claudopus]|uniref:Uncharacterized protein n=1 Tax=Favolaschia claudopus TaxID=2862362 RepID=A0AAW0B069_9AGAR
MSGMFYVDARGKIPDPDIREMKEVVWVGLNCSLDLVPPKAWDYINRFSYHSHTASTNSEGWFEDMEYAWRPDWDQHDRFFRAWIPVIKGGPDELKGLWYMSRLLNSRRVAPNPQDKWLIPNPLRENIVADLKLAETIVEGIASKSPFFGKVPRPPPFYYDSLYRTRETQKEACSLLASAVRSMLEHLGFIYWRISTDFDWQRDLTNYIIRAIEDFKLHQFGKRGVLLHLARDWKEMNVPLFLKHEVPVAYPWTLHERVDMRFACLAPSVLAALNEKKRSLVGEGNLEFSDFVCASESFEAANSYTIYLDDPVVDRTEDRRKPVIPRKAVKVMKDFPHWAARPINNKKLVNHYRQRYQYDIVGGVVIFWRFRPVIPVGTSDSVTIDWMEQDREDAGSEGEFDDEEDDDLEGLDSIDRIREIYKGSYAPRPGQAFDQETGRELSKPYRGNDCFIQLHEALSAKIPTAPSSQAFRGPHEMVEDLARRIREDDLQPMEVDPAGTPSSTPAELGSHTIAEKTSQGIDSSTTSSFTVTTSLIDRISDFTDSAFDFPDPEGSLNDEAASSSLTTSSAEAPRRGGGPTLLSRLSDPGNFPKSQKQSSKDTGSPSQKPLLAGKAPPTAPRGMRTGNERRTLPSTTPSQGPSGSGAVLLSNRSAEKRPLKSRPSTSRTRSASPDPSRRSRSIRPRPRSPSPLLVAANLPAQQKTKLEAWVSHAKGLVLPKAFREFPSDYYWDNHFLNYAYLVLPTKEARVKLRVICCTKNIVDVRDLLSEMVLRGISHRLAIPLKALDKFAAGELSMADRVLGKSIYEVGTSPDPPLEYGRGGPVFATAYHNRMRQILALPHARCLAARGGICAWLAWTYEPGLIDAYTSGPSMQTTRFVRGWNDTEMEQPAFIWADELSSSELDGLLGHVVDPSGNVDRWVWPPDSMLREFCDHYDGELSENLDLALKVTQKEVNNKDTLRARSRSQWFQFFRKGNRTAAGPSSELAQAHTADREARYDDEEDRMNRLFVDRWERLPVLELDLPGRLA